VDLPWCTPQVVVALPQFLEEVDIVLVVMEEFPLPRLEVTPLLPAVVGVELGYMHLILVEQVQMALSSCDTQLVYLR
jgi:hypothetical protein